MSDIEQISTIVDARLGGDATTSADLMHLITQYGISCVRGEL